MKKFVAENINDTFKIAKRFSRILNSGDVVGLWGKLGSGKTTFIKEVAKNFGVSRDKVTSSSFVILKQYQGKIPIYHVDLYRLTSRQIPDEVYEHISGKKGLVLIEWADKIEMPREYFRINIELLTLTSRRITIEACGNTSNKRLSLGKL